MTVPHIEVKYTNWRNETGIREIRPNSVYYSGSDIWHGAGWRLSCWDIEKQDWRTYNLADCDFTMQGSLETAFNAVKEFHGTFNAPVGERPEALTADRAEARAQWSGEELAEFIEVSCGVNIRNEMKELIAQAFARKVAEPDLVGQVDSAIDRIYFALGDLVEIGIEPSPIFDMVQDANMAKLWSDGKPRFREDGKIIKPEGWKSPDDKIAAYIKGLSE